MFTAIITWFQHNILNKNHVLIKPLKLNVIVIAISIENSASQCYNSSNQVLKELVCKYLIL